jgi:hypothetical protein
MGQPKVGGWFLHLGGEPVELDSVQIPEVQGDDLGTLTLEAIPPIRIELRGPARPLSPLQRIQRPSRAGFLSSACFNRRVG